MKEIKELVRFKPTLKTMEAVRYLDHKKYHRHKLYKLKHELGGKRFGKGRNLVFDTAKIVELKIRLKEAI